MRLILQAITALLVIISNVAITLAQKADNNFAETMEERAKRDLDFGDLLRNLLLKSATASNVKGNVVRNVLNSKTTTLPPRKRPTTTTTTTTTMAPLFVKGPFRFPFDLSNYGLVNKFNPSNKFNNAGYINFDYNDYGAQRPVRPARKRRPTTTTTSTTTTTTTTTQAPTKRRPLPPIHYGRFGKQKLVNSDYYDDDYDYNYDEAEATPTTPPPTPPRRKRPTTANRARAQGRLPQLRTRLVYQYRQPDDTSINDDDADNGDINTPLADNANEDSNNNSNNETSADANDSNDDSDKINDASASADLNNVENNNDSSDNANANTNDNISSNNDNVDNIPNDSLSIAPNSNINTDNPPPPLPYYNPQLAAASGFDGTKDQTQLNVHGPGHALAAFQYPSYNDFTTQYQPHSPTAYSVRYY